MLVKIKIENMGVKNQVSEDKLFILLREICCEIKEEIGFKITNSGDGDNHVDENKDKIEIMRINKNRGEEPKRELIAGSKVEKISTIIKV